MDEKVCKNCKWWSIHWNVDHLGVADCDSPSPKFSIMTDGDAQGTLLTNQEFGCNQWEAK